MNSDVWYLQTSDLEPGPDGRPRLKAYVTQGKPVVVMAQYDGCPACTGAKPAYQTLASSYGKISTQGQVLGEMRCCAFDLHGDESVGEGMTLKPVLDLWVPEMRGVPTFLGFNSRGQFVRIHTGDRNQAALLAFARTLNSGSSFASTVPMGPPGQLPPMSSGPSMSSGHSMVPNPRESYAAALGTPGMGHSASSETHVGGGVSAANAPESGEPAYDPDGPDPTTRDQPDSVRKSEPERELPEKLRLFLGKFSSQKVFGSLIQRAFGPERAFGLQRSGQSSDRVSSTPPEI